MFLEDFVQPVINNVEVIILITSPTAFFFSSSSFFCECVCVYMCVVVQKAA